MREFAKRLMAHETKGNKSSGKSVPEAFQVYDRLGPPLATLMGTGGFRALISRSLALASAEVPWLRAVQVKADGSLEGLESLSAQLDQKEFLEGRVVLLAQLLGLLEAFIGPSLTLRLMGDVWPQVQFNDSNFRNGTNNEISKSN